MYVLRTLQEQDLVNLLHHVIAKDAVLQQHKIVLQQTGALTNISGGDARKLLNLLELVVNQAKQATITVTDDMVMAIAQQKIALYDKQGEQHYDIISAFIKSTFCGL